MTAKAGRERSPAPPNGWTTALLLIALVAAPALVQAQGVTPEGLTFHASFEDGLDADFAEGGGAATAEGAPEITEGPVSYTHLRAHET